MQTSIEDENVANYFFLEYCGLDNQTHRIIIEANSLIISYMQVLFKKWKKKKKGNWNWLQCEHTWCV